jgi:hypothetical protein
MLVPPVTAEAHQDRPFADLSNAALEETLTRAAFHGDRDEWLLQLLMLERNTRRMLSGDTPG